MLGNDPYYHELIRKSVILFGRIFDEIVIVRSSNVDSKEIQRFLVPIVYSPKEKMITRIMSDPDLMRQVQTILPRMGFEITGIMYDATRKQNSLLQLAAPGTSTTASSVYMGVPYDLTFTLYVYSRNIADGAQIVEQILPFFNPEFTVTTNMVPELGFLKDVPITLNNVSNDISYEGNFDSVRYVYWTLTFTMKTYFYGPIQYPKYIRTAYTDVYVDPTTDVDSRYCKYTSYLNITNASGVFKQHDMVYQGRSPKEATGYGYVMDYDAANEQIVIGGTQGKFTVNNKIHAVSTNGVCTVESLIYPPIKAMRETATPDPVTAVPGDDYGYSYELTVFPDTED